MKTENIPASPKRMLGTFTLAMMTVAAIVSLRNLPLSAEYGLASIFYFAISALIFFIPVALVTAELATGWPHAGGAYIWIGEAFGKAWGFYTLWISWIGIVAWFPAILAFTAAMLAHLMEPFFPGILGSKAFYFIVMLSVFWGATFLNFLGIKTSGLVSSLSVLCGTVIPGFLIIALGIWWVFTGHEMHISFQWSSLLPEFQLGSVVLFAGILSSLVGVEVAAYHIGETARPQKDYPRALMISTLLILFISVLGTLAIAVVVPQKEINLISGLIQAFSIFLNAFDLSWAISVLALLALLGSLASINTWLVGPSKGLLVTAQDGYLPAPLGRVNANGAPVGMLLLQAILGTVLSCAYLWLDSQSAAYWALTAFSAQFSFLQYALVLAAAVKLRYSKPNQERAYKVPGGKFCIWLVVIIGVLACLFGFVIAFVPPVQLETGDKTIYMAVLAGSFVLLSSIPLIFILKIKRIDVRKCFQNNISPPLSHIRSEIS